MQLAEEAAAAAEVRAHELAAALSAAEQARSDAEADLQQGAAELQGLVAEAAQQAAREEAATAAAAEQAAALAAKERQVELLRAQLAARDAQASSSKRHRWVHTIMSPCRSCGRRHATAGGSRPRERSRQRMVGRELTLKVVCDGWFKRFPVACLAVTRRCSSAWLWWRQRRRRCRTSTSACCS